ncbi:unnamed protein product [Parnassius mnemosyne]|uniref:Integrase catalytic domain-containing protein n=1 Tax=Parnassius mnemosyne TaxID=213953 RepID=A0AAV1KLK2_9NEOP
MENAKKMILIEPGLIEKLKQENKVNSNLSRLDIEMQNIMNSKTEDRKKWILYLQTLQRYLHFTEEDRQPLKLPIYSDTSNEDSNESKIGFKNKDRDLKTSVDIESLLEENRSIKSKENDENPLYTPAQILSLIPKTYHKKGQLLLNLVETSKSKMHWDNEGTVIIDSEKIPGSNIVDLINDSLRPLKRSDPVGWVRFAEALKDIKVPLTYIGNPRRLGKMDSVLEEINRIYYDPSNPAGFGSIDKLSKAMKGKMNKKQVKEWLKSQETYTLHKPIRKKFPRNRYILSNINELWQADLSDMRTYSQHNDGFKYILCIIDVFSKYAFARPMKKKNSETTKECFESIFTESNLTPTHIQSDKGTEFVSKDVQKYFKSKKINYYTTNNPDIKASIVERFQRTLKMKMWRYFTHNNTYRYIDVLQDLIYSYNHSFHSSIKMCPCDVNSNNIMTVWTNLYDRRSKKLSLENPKPNFNVGDYVRITKYKHVFQKGYESNWSDEIFIISSIIDRSPWVVYTITDLQNEPIIGTFYERELQKITYNPTSQHKIDKIIDTRYSGNRKEVLVKWKGYPDKFNSWILASSLKEI